MDAQEDPMQTSTLVRGGMAALLVTSGACATAVGAAPLEATNAGAPEIGFHYDVAPNVYGSPDWGPWLQDTRQDVASGSFTNMRSGAFPGQAKVAPREIISYSTGDKGSRTHFIWHLPDYTELGGSGGIELQTKMAFDWNGTPYALDGASAVPDGPGAGWASPGSATYSVYAGDGLIGTFSFAWWATDNEAPPPDTTGSPYDETNEADIAALADEVLAAQDYVVGKVRWRETGTEAWTTGPSARLQVSQVPAPAPLGLLLAGGGLLYLGRRSAR
jgi:hypothetical protein